MKLIPLEEVKKILCLITEESIWYYIGEIESIPTIDPIAIIDAEIDKMIEELEWNADWPKIARATLVELKRRLSLTQK